MEEEVISEPTIRLSFNSKEMTSPEVKALDDWKAWKSFPDFHLDSSYRVITQNRCWEDSSGENRMELERER
ncbi:hypothetical protein CEXT_3171 [Caerostris extrusa]|uniref:Uncharacterized protein n=1 Tax=Caerostris extrusa TaxID=172846 RepID=A0AAV4PEP4_CAEEX|nr:hypothetical protein CEXT_3171 [Caerostris extrusa]